MKKRVNTWDGLKKGTKFKVIANTNGNNYPLNKILTMNKDGRGIMMLDIAAEHPCGNNLRAAEIELCPETLNDLRDKVKEIEKELKETLSKIDFCKESGLDYFDESAQKTFLILQELTKYNDDMDKAIKISKIINT